VWNAIRSWRYGEVTTADDPWGYGNSLEWATSSPPPRHNFTALPRIRSERPAFDLHHPWLAERLILEGPHSPSRHWHPVTQDEIDQYLSAHSAPTRLGG
jgi:cytochrome c oxidase subunit 1